MIRYNANQLRLATSKEIRKLDNLTIESGVPGLELMHRAGLACYKKILNQYNQEIKDPDCKILILCGSGNNGGDGLTIALEFLADQYPVEVIITDSQNYSSEFLAQLTKLKNLTENIYVYDADKNTLETNSITQDDFKFLVQSADIIIDALLGTGQSDAPRGAVAEILNCIQEHSQAIQIAIDLPTGIHSDTGQVLSEDAFVADLCICIEIIKLGLLQQPARSHSDILTVVPIDLVNNQNDLTEYALTVPSLKFAFTRELDSHKGDFGHVLVVAGSKTYPGAAWLASYAALKTGAGMVTKSQLDSDNGADFPEIIRLVVDYEAVEFGSKHLDPVLDYAKKCNVLLVGPGIGLSEQTAEFVYQLLKQSSLPKVLDADALNIIAKFDNKQISNLDFTNSIFTPHPGEAARLLNTDTSQVQVNRYQSAENLYEKFQATVLLKGAASVICGASAKFVNPTGNPFMATAGSGDVLSGIIASLLAQGQSNLDAARYGAAIHGLAGNYAFRQTSGPIVASEISDQIGKAITELVSFNSYQQIPEFIDSYLNF